MPSRRLATIAFAATVALGLLGLFGVMLKDDSKQVQTLGVQPVMPVAPIGKGGQACEHLVGLAEPLERVRFQATTMRKPGPPLEVTVSAASGLVMGRGRIPWGWIDDGHPLEAVVGRVEDDRPVSICIRNLGRVRTYIWGDALVGSIRDGDQGIRPTVTPAYGTANGYPIEDDLALTFVTDRPRSFVTRLPAVFRHAASFRPSIVGPWTYWLLLVCLVLAVPALLVTALRSAFRSDVEQPEVEPAAAQVESEPAAELGATR